MTLFRVRGIPIRLHSSFLLLALAMFAWELFTSGVGAAAMGLSMGAALFTSVLLHELGHALTARAFGIPTRDITLYPFGGIAALTREPATPTQEILIAVAGPAVNLLLGGVALVGWMFGIPGAGPLVLINMVMGVFNLLPAYPMDGGRVLRAWWTRRMGAGPATLRALQLTRWFAWALVLAGVVWTPSLLLVGGFLLFVGAGERRVWRARAALEGHRPEQRAPPLVWDGHWEHPTPEARRL